MLFLKKLLNIGKFLLYNEVVFIRGVSVIYHLAIDIGASSGRHILGYVDNGKLFLEEVYRFDNGTKEKDGSLIWDLEALVFHVKSGIKKCHDLGKLPKTVAIDTWGVDYVLLDRHGNEILPAVAYRDKRTGKAVEEVSKILSQQELYSVTGIQKQAFNTVYQLWCDKTDGKLENAESLLMIPEYLSFKLTGVMKNEYTNATTTGLVNAETKDWDTNLIKKLGFPEKLFKPLYTPCTAVGMFKEELQKEFGFNCEVILCPSHDTASAVAACPIDDRSVYISSGTWSLIGTENSFPVLSEKALRANFTNEGGAEYRYRFLKNIPGMWLFQSIRKEINKSMTYDEMMHLAMESSFSETVDLNAPELTAPKSMINAIRSLSGKNALPLADVLACAYRSLALSYKKAIEEIEEISNKKTTSVFLVGGGSRDAYLNRLTASLTGKKVLTGLTEATATGNLISQVMYTHKLSLSQGREIVKNSFEIKEID